MSVVSVEARSFILALFIRDDGERFLLGDNGYDFIDSQLHFAANTIENDEVEKQGTDGTMLAGQVRRASVQTFDGYVGDATTPKDKVEEMRREFIAFFAKDHHFRVIYVDCNRNAWQRKGGYLVDAPEVKELWQIHPEYHVGLNFEDVNYYEYDENADGQEILANIMKVPISSDVEGGLVWDEDGAVSEDATVVYDGDTATASGKSISVSDAVEAPLADFKLKGEASQQTYTGKNLVYTSGKTDGGITATYNAATGETTISGTAVRTYAVFGAVADVLPAGTYTFSIQSAAPCAVGVATKASGGTRAGHPISAGATKTTFTISEDSEQYDIYLTGLTANTAYSFTFKAMLESGSSATPFEPYTNGPAPNPDYPQAVQTVTGENTLTISDGENTQSYEINLGKNLLEMPIESGSSNGITWTVQDDGSIILNGTSTAGVNIRANNVTIPAVEGETYTLSATGMGEAYNFGYKNSSSGDNIFVVTSASPTTTAVVTSTMLSQANRLDMYIQSGKTFNNQRVTLQLEKGSQATSYAAYFTPVELCKIGDYQDYIYKSGDKWYVRKEIGKIQSYAGETISTDYISTTGSLTTGATIYYALATPTDTEITNEALVAQLEAILSQGKTYAGTNNITTVIAAGNEQGELEITYYTSYEAKVVGGGYVWEEGGSGGPTIVTNESISAVSPVWTVFGPALNPQLENVTTGEQIQYVGMIGEGQTLVIDMGQQTALLDGLNVVANIVGDYLSLAPGSNTLLFSADSDAPESEIGWSEIVG